MNEVVKRLRILHSLSYGDIESMSEPTVEGHRGRLVLAELSSGKVLLFEGRRHVYEGAGMGDVGGAVKLAKELGCRFVLVTSAAGSLRRDVPEGSWFLPDDVTYFPQSGGFFRYLAGAGIETSGSAEEEGGRDKDAWGGMTSWSNVGLISSRLREMVRNGLVTADVPFSEGVLLWTSGPTYETRAEVECGLLMNASAVTMSSYPELLVACSAGIEACPICWISNYTANISMNPTGHDDVLEKGRRSAATLERLLDVLLEYIAEGT